MSDPQIAEVPEYYLFNAELDILKTYGTEIALRIFGHTTPQSAHFAGSYKDAMRTPKPNFDDEGHGPDGAPETVHEDGVPNGGGGGLEHSVKRKEKWGDQQVGRFNGGVNAEEGMDGDRAVGCASLVELGAGSLRKTVHLIRALAELPKGSEAERTDPNVQYYALDLDKAELVRTLEELRTQEAGKQETGDWTVLDGQVGLNGMWATYDQGESHASLSLLVIAEYSAERSAACAFTGLDFIGKGGLKADKAEGKRCLLWLGSSIGNFDRRGAAEFLRTAASTALRAGDTMLVSVDRRNKPEEVALAYHDPAGVTTDFIMNGLDHADRVLGGNVLDKSKFEYYDRYNDTEGRHESYYRSLCDQTITVPGEDPIQMSTGELIHVESSYKYSEREALDLFDAAGLRVVQRWEDSSSRYDVWLVERPNFHFSSSRLLTGTRAELESGISIQNANKAKGVNGMDSDGGMGSHGISQDTELVSNWGLPSLDEWDNMWKAWDTVTLTMIPRNMLFEKPIDLRRECSKAFPVRASLLGC